MKVMSRDCPMSVRWARLGFRCMWWTQTTVLRDIPDTAGHFSNVRRLETDALADFLIRLAADQRIKDWLLLPSNDHAVLTLSRNKKRLEKYFKVITPDLGIIENIYDKSRLLRIAEKTGVAVPDTFYASNTDADGFSLLFPVLTRGRFGLDFYKATGRKAFLANDFEELRSQLSFVDKFFSVQKTLTQELIPDDGQIKPYRLPHFALAGISGPTGWEKSCGSIQSVLAQPPSQKAFMLKTAMLNLNGC